ncbi:hypothetical protein K493DRAFT_336881 [Basidiobolus meristosporus CBS 931.73]|uniref:DUF1308 domain-containing protein n=1 Tax=Basidiobolus meristosporus CBS 931.73 TaxID=1314790 RepID=A0A1Y1YEQ9_9FUNG|nr:hypothetical protein K493DRAFT_336881 [Basidiobolus meristosporus CBS 931.73]|eukprot:ORX96531.1 hypothetical protein K493DRAFT_336881 [Basidiobolus meristosporus CBS 931.73]
MDGNSPDEVAFLEEASPQILKEQAVALLKEIEPYQGKIAGISKLERGIVAELSYLEKTPTDEIDLNCTNLKYYSAIVETLKHSSRPIAVLNGYRYYPKQTKHLQKVLVDVVAEDGQKWIKVSKLYKRGGHKCSVESDYSDFEDPWPHSKDSPLLRYARKMLEASRQNLLHFKPPKIAFVKYEEIEDSLTLYLRSVGILIEEPYKPTSRTSFIPDRYEHYCTELNLDVTSLIALVSDLTHSLTRPIDPQVFKEKPLMDQASQELSEPILPMFTRLFYTRTLYTTRSAYTKFFELITLIGGERETIRANQIFTKVAIPYQGSSELFCSWKRLGFSEVPFVSVIEDQPSPRFSELFSHPNRPKKFTALTMAVFGTGDQLKMTTVTGKSSTSRSLEQIELKSWSVFEHSPRSLVEKRLSL